MLVKLNCVAEHKDSAIYSAPLLVSTSICWAQDSFYLFIATYLRNERQLISVYFGDTVRSCFKALFSYINSCFLYSTEDVYAHYFRIPAVKEIMKSQL